MVSGRASCPRNQEVARTPSMLLGTGRTATAPSVKESGDTEEGGSKEAEQVQDASRVPGGGGEGEERRGGASETEGEMLSQVSLSW